jgi:hypothetical protein
MSPLLILIAMAIDITQGDPDEFTVRPLERDPLMDLLMPRDMGTLCGKYFLLVGKEDGPELSSPRVVHFVYSGGSELIDRKKLTGVLDPKRSKPLARRTEDGGWVIELNQTDWLESDPCLPREVSAYQLISR